MKKFSWGKVLDCFEYDFDGDMLSVTKYHPFKYENNCAINGQFSDEINYHVEEMHESFNSMHSMLIAWVTYKNLGYNNGALAAGKCRALEIKQ